MSEPRPDQRKILEDPARIRVVQAVPGSGKTWLIAQDLTRRLTNWREQHRGIAALSFTNAARDEIHKALGFLPSHPHFIGTLDSFLFRYIVKPFARLLQPDLPPLKIVPGDYAAALAEKQKWFPNDNLKVRVGKEDYMWKNIFLVDFREMKGGKPIFETRLLPGKPPLRIEGYYADEVLKKKRKIWLSSGRLSHSDTTYFAFKVLKSSLRNEVLTLLSRRFPVLVVDEAQDTGWYLARVLQELLKHTNFRALLVGDPDQAIFEFSGATPALFGDFLKIGGASPHEMNYSRRCSSRVRRVSEKLMGIPRVMEGRDEEGRAILASFSGNGHDALHSFCGRCKDRGLSYSLLLRWNAEIGKLNSEIAHQKVGFASPPLGRIYSAVQHLRTGKSRKALSLCDTVLSSLVFETDHIGEEDLRSAGVDSFMWRSGLVQILTEAARRVENENRHQWGIRQREKLTETILGMGLVLVKKVRAPKTALKQQPAWTDEELLKKRFLCSTVHAVKGKTLETTIFFLPKKNASKCPSLLWWQENSEERRVAYVAATRARKTFVLCVHEDVLARLRISQPDFVEQFEVQQLQELNPDWD